MQERIIALDLSQQQLLMFFAHLFIYLDCQDSFRDGPSIETVKHIGSRVFALYRQGGARATLTLTMGEARALKLVFRSLVQCYSNHPPSAYDTKASRDLAMCRALLQRAKRHAGRTSREASNL
jgi:hypothetical protein